MNGMAVSSSRGNASFEESDPQRVTDLIADARLVLIYAARSGRLLNKSLAEAMVCASSGSADNKITDDHIMALTSALNESIQTIAPVTLIDLGSKWRPFPRSKMSRCIRIMFSFFAVLLVAATAYFTQFYSQMNSILAALRDIQSQNAIDKAERLFRFTVKNHQDIFNATEKKDQDDIKFEPYLKYYEDLIKINDQILTFQPLSLEMIDRARDPIGIVSALSKIYSWFGGGGENVANPYEKNYDNPPAADQPPSALAQAEGDNAEPIDALIKKQAQLAQFLFYLGVGYLGPPAPRGNADLSGGGTSPLAISSLIYQCQKVTAMHGTWLLPALYGLLGTVVFQMRAILNPFIPDPPLERLLIRFSLGALAGISMSWLFGSTPAKFFEAQSLNTTLFGVSFVFGFSIDIFFALLDRTVGILSGSIAKMAQ